MSDEKTLLALCPSCHVHVRVERSQPRVECPFCETEFGASDTRRSMRLVGALMRGKGIAAASMVSLSMLVGCDADDDVDTSTDVEWNEPDAPLASDVYGLPADMDGGSSDAPSSEPDGNWSEADAPMIGDVYGLPADVGDGSGADVEDIDADDH